MIIDPLYASAVRPLHRRCGQCRNDGEGRFLALRAQWKAAIGAYFSTDRPTIPLTIGLGCLVNTYGIPAVHAQVIAVLTNSMSIAPYRGGSRPEPIYVIETDDCFNLADYRRVAERHRQVGRGRAWREPGWLNGVMTTARDPIYAGHRYPAEIISYAVWLYFQFPLSRRMVEEMLAARGISVTHETIRQWGLKFGREFANRIRQRASRRGDKWHLDGVSRTRF
jgi:putative transposase